MVRAFFTKGSLFSSDIEPDTSTRNTRLESGPLLFGDFPAFQTKPHQAMFWLPGADGDFGVHRERIAIDRRSVIVLEVVDEFFNPHGINRRALAMLDKPPYVGIRRRVHINRKRRKRLLASRDEKGVLEDRLVTFIPGLAFFLAFEIGFQLITQSKSQSPPTESRILAFASQTFPQGFRLERRFVPEIQSLDKRFGSGCGLSG